MKQEDKALQEALDEAADLHSDAAEVDGWLRPEVVEACRGLLRRLYRRHPCRYSVGPFGGGRGRQDDREMSAAIDARSGRGIVAICCDPDGSALLIRTLDQKNQTVRYRSAEELPDELTLSALRELDE